jgi:hypothetical protein
MKYQTDESRARWAYENFRRALRHPSIFPYSLFHRDIESIRTQFHVLDLRRPPWPEVRSRTIGGPQRTFTFNGQDYPYHFAEYNFAWANERCVELAIALPFIQAHEGNDLIEIGNVGSHYHRSSPGWVVLDKYEISPRVVNEDLLDYDPRRKFKFLVSISTIEHIGWDEIPRDVSGAKTRLALSRLADLISPDGRAVVTFPVGYNEALDRTVAAGDHPFHRVDYLKRISWDNSWIQVSQNELGNPTYGDWSFGCWRRADRALEPGVFPWANVVAIGQI